MVKSTSLTKISENKIQLPAKTINGPCCCCVKNDLIISQNEKILSLLKPSRGNFSPVVNKLIINSF